MTTIPQRHRRTGGNTTCYGNTALCAASRGKKNIKLTCATTALVTFQSSDTVQSHGKLVTAPDNETISPETSGIATLQDHAVIPYFRMHGLE